MADASWWPMSIAAGGAVEEMVTRLWRHSVAVSIAARNAGTRCGRPRSRRRVAARPCCARLGCWAVAAVDREWLLRWWQEESPASHRRRELADLGTELDDLGRRLAERWGCDPLVVDAVWLHAIAAALTISRIARRPIWLSSRRHATGPSRRPLGARPVVRKGRCRPSHGCEF